MNARNQAEVQAIETEFDAPVEGMTPVVPVETTAIVPAVADKARLEVTEILDAVAKDEKKNTIGGIVPLKYSLTSALLADMLKKYSGIQYDTTQPEGRKLAKAAASDLKAAANKMEDEYKSWNSPIMAMTKHARDQKGKAIDVLEAIRKPIVEALDAVKRAEEEAEAKRAAAESARIGAHNEALAALEAMPGQFVTASVATIDAALEELRAHDYLNFRNWDEYGDKARALQSEAVTALAAHRENAVAREALQAERDARAAEDAKRAADAAVQERITVITTAPMSVFGKPAADIKRLLDRLNKTDVATFGEHSVQAAGALSQAVQMVGMMLSQAEAAEAKEAELARLQAEEAQRAAAAEQAKRDEEAALQARENAARLEAERLEREVAEAAAREQQQKAQAEADASQARVRAMSARRQRLEDQAEVMHGILASARDVLAQAGRADLVESIDEVFAAIEGA